jgi:hypothetical protein
MEFFCPAVGLSKDFIRQRIPSEGWEEIARDVSAASSTASA